MKRNNSNPHQTKATRTAAAAQAATATAAEQPQAIEAQTERDGDQLFVTCRACKTQTEVQKAVVGNCLRCPECGAWIRVRLTPDHSRYVRGLGLTASGCETYDIADETADLLRSLSLDELYKTASRKLHEQGKEAMSRAFRKSYGNADWTTEQIERYLSERYFQRNPGMQRMNLGNLIRNASKRAA